MGWLVGWWLIDSKWMLRTNWAFLCLDAFIFTLMMWEFWFYFLIFSCAVVLVICSLRFENCGNCRLVFVAWWKCVNWCCVWKCSANWCEHSLELSVKGDNLWNSKNKWIRLWFHNYAIYFQKNVPLSNNNSNRDDTLTALYMHSMLLFNLHLEFRWKFLSRPIRPLLPSCSSHKQITHCCIQLSCLHKNASIISSGQKSHW